MLPGCFRLGGGPIYWPLLFKERKRPVGVVNHTYHLFCTEVSAGCIEVSEVQRGSPGGSAVKNLPATREARFESLGMGDALGGGNDNPF